jgi:hypothetical protein
LCIPAHALDVGEVLGWLAAERITTLHAVPSLARAWLDEAPRVVPLPSMRWLFLSGEPLLDTLVEGWGRALAASGRIVNLYGPTETTMAKCFAVVPTVPAPGAQPVGVPLPETQALVLAESGRLCGVNEPGEIVLRTPFGTRGYINAPEEQRLRFVASPFRRDARDVLYRTGDRGRYGPDGSLVVLGRLDHQVKVRGVRVEPDEVAAALSRHASVRACVVVGWANAAQVATLVAYIVAEPHGIDGAALRAYLAERLPLAMIPSSFVFLERLPLTATGKVDRQALPMPGLAAAAPGSAHVAPGTPQEKRLAAIWAEVLGLERVGIHDDFFALGGHSLLATRVASRIQQAFAADVPLRWLFERPTVAQLAELLARHEGRAPSAPPPVPAASDRGRDAGSEAERAADLRERIARLSPEKRALLQLHLPRSAP